MLIAAPVSARDGCQFEGIRLDLPRIFYVRPTAQVYEGILLVNGYLRLLLERIPVFVQAALFKPDDQLYFIGLVLENFARFFR